MSTAHLLSFGESDERGTASTAPALASNPCLRGVADVGDGSKDTSPLPGWRRVLCSDDGPTPNARLVAMAMSLWMRADGYGHPGARMLGRWTGLSERTIRTALAELTAKGWLVLVEQGGLKGEARRANGYQAFIPNGGSTGTHANAAPVHGSTQTPAPVAARTEKRSVKPRDADPMEATARAAAAIRERNHLRSVGKACENCGGSYWLDTEPPTRCPECAA